MFTEFCVTEIDFATHAMFSHFTIKHGMHVLSCINHIIVCLLQTNSVKYVNIFKRRIDEIDIKVDIPISVQLTKTSIFP